MKVVGAFGRSMLEPARRRCPVAHLRRSTGPFSALATTAALLLLMQSAVAGLRARPEPNSLPRPGLKSGLNATTLAVVINTADPLSEAIGRQYIRTRRLSPRQVIRVHFQPAPSLSRQAFQHLYQQVHRQTSPDTQAYALAWLTPWRVECVSITSAFTFGRLRSGCANTCDVTPINPYYGRGDVLRPWDRLGMRPSMLLAATSLERAQALIERGVAADGTAPSGTAYLLSSTDPIRNVRAAGYSAIQELLGPVFRIRLLWTDALRRATDVMLLSIGAQHVPDLTSNRYRPGAIADHLTSYGGVLTGPSGQMSALRWLEAGATASYGTVVEPCNHTAKFPNPGLALAYYRRGDTLIESYWRSVAMPDQGVFIGEPLARPWGRRRNM